MGNELMVTELLGTLLCVKDKIPPPRNEVPKKRFVSTICCCTHFGDDDKHGVPLVKYHPLFVQHIREIKHSTYKY